MTPPVPSRIVRVVPDLPSFAVDSGFEYAAPPALESVPIGSIVRVPLSGRKVRGHVIEERYGDPSELKEVRSVSGHGPVFHRDLLQTLRWAAHHYVAPLSVLLSRSGPPNLARQVAARSLPSIPPLSSPVGEVSSAAAAGRRVPAVHLLAGGGWSELVRGTVTDPLRAGRSALVVVSTAVEAGALAEHLRKDLGRRVVEVSDGADAVVTTAWSTAAQQSGLVVVGTPRVAWWPVRDLSVAIVVDPGRRAMKERQTPALSVPAVMAARARVERFNLLSISRVPTIEALAAGVSIERQSGRLWPLVEVVDRTEDPPGAGVVTGRARRAIAGAVKAGMPVFVFTHRRGYAPASRCVTCRTLRSCPQCGARPDPGTECRRCGAALGPCISCGSRRFEPLGAAVGRVIEELRRVVGGAVGDATTGSQVVVGTERDLAARAPVGLSVAVDVDGLVRGTNYRAGEDALAVLARVGGLVAPGSGHRMIVQTAEPAHPVIGALRRGDPLDYLRDELKVRLDLALPPAGDVIVLEIGGDVDTTELTAVLEGATVFGPAPAGDRLRWLIQGSDLRLVRSGLRSVIGKLRDRGARVRVDVDPRDL